ncbi:MAG: PH domain-containing protein [Acidobacteriota bacterium]
MYCIKCGTNNSDAANFCRKCGELMEPEDETQVAARNVGAVADVRAEYRSDTEKQVQTLPAVTDDETDPPIFAIGPTLMFVKIGYVLAAIGALLLVGILSMFSVSAWISILMGLLLFLIPAYYHLRAKLVRYSLTSTQIEVDSGLVGRTTRNIPLRRIQDVTVATSATQRLLGFGDLVIDNASELGGKVVLKNINSPKQYADLMLKQMRRLEGR